MKRTVVFLFLSLPCQGGGWSMREADGNVEARFGGEAQASWRQALTADPAGGARFRNSAFFHPVTTPSGFVWTDAQPGDHPHHAGLWWPWKFV